MRNFVYTILLVAVMVSMFGCESYKVSKSDSDALSSYKKDMHKINKTYSEKCGIVKRLYRARNAELERGKHNSEKNAIHKERDGILRDLLTEKENDIRKSWKKYRNEELKGIASANQYSHTQ